MEDKQPLYKRVLIKLSGEALSAGADGILNYAFLETICSVIKRCVDMGVEISIVVGAGNIWRGRQGTGMDRTRADHMGMLATVINCLALQDTFERMGVETRVMTAIEMKECAEPYIRNKAISHLKKGRVVIFGCGIGSPYFSTDTAAVLRAAEIIQQILSWIRKRKKLTVLSILTFCVTDFVYWILRQLHSVWKIIFRFFFSDWMTLKIL